MNHSILAVNLVPAKAGSLDGFEAVCSCGDRYRNSLSASAARRDGDDHARFMVKKSAKGGRR